MRGIYAKADGQLGLVTRSDLRALGVSDHQLVTLVKKGLLVPVHRAVFRTAGAAETLEQRALGACLALGSPAVVSFGTAAALWKLLEWDGAIHVTLPYARRSTRAGIVVHRSTVLAGCDRTMFGLVPVTTAARTLVDLAGVLERPTLERSLDEALRRGLVTPARLTAALERRAQAPGRRTLTELVRDRTGHGVPESELERIAIRLIARARLPVPVRQLEVRARGRLYRLDLAYPDHRVAIELDGRAPHWGRDRWEADHVRENALKLDGWQVLHFTWTDITRRGATVTQQIAEALGVGS